MTSKLIQIIPFLLLGSCTVAIPLSTSDTTSAESAKSETEIKKEEALNVQKVQAEQKARQAEESKNPEAKEDKGGGLF